MRSRTSVRTARHFFLVWICATATIGGAGEATLPHGVTLGQREDGRNSVRIEIGADSLVVDALTLTPASDTGGTTFTIQTGEGDATRIPVEHVALVPEDRRGNDAWPSLTSIVVSSGFTMGSGDRRVEILSFGRGATAADAAVWLPEDRTLVTGRLCDAAGLESTPESDTDAWENALSELLDLEPRVVIPGDGAPGGPDLLARQLARISDLRSHLKTSLLAGMTEPEAFAAYDAPWFATWREHAPRAAGRAFRAVYEEVGGLRTPWQLVEDRKLRAGPSPTKDDPGWTRPRKVLWRNWWPDLFPMLAIVAPEVEIIPFTTSEEALENIRGADALIGAADAELLAAGDSLRWVQVGSAGVERYLTIPELADGRVLLTNGQRLASPVIAEHVMALVRALARGLNRTVVAQQNGSWERSEIGNSAPLTTLRGKTLLVVGLGGIGTEVARLADAAGMRVTAIRNSSRSGPPFVARVGLAEDLPAYLGEADVVVNCLPMTPETDDLFDTELFGAMKPTAFFVNVGRGGTVDTDALVAALVSGRIAGAGLDVTDPEPLPPDHPLWKAPNLIITPHFAAWSDDDSSLLWLLFRENLRRFVAGEELLSVVDPTRGY